MHRTLLAAALAAALFSTTPVFEPLWRFLGSFWSEEGCRIDPNGRCLPATAGAPAAPGDTGCYIDPNGLCTP